MECTVTGIFLQSVREKETNLVQKHVSYQGKGTNVRDDGNLIQKLTKVAKTSCLLPCLHHLGTRQQD